MSTERKQVAVLGAGVIGLCCAVQLQESLSSKVQVTLLADKFNEETTSDGAAGSFRPTVDYIPGVPRDILIKWCRESFQFYSKLAESAEASDAGISWISGHHIFIDQQKEKDPIYREIVHNYRTCGRQEIEALYSNTDRTHYSANFTTLMIECRWFLPWLLNRFRKAGGIVKKQHIDHMTELTGRFDLVVNCTGLGSVTLFHDDKLMPNRGQMIRVKAPWIKHFLYIDHSTWIIPGKETVVIGGTRQPGESSTDIRPEETKHLWDTACKYMPSLRNAQLNSEWVGLRPTRTTIRIEKQTMNVNGQRLEVIHNYGHGGNGVSLAWGTAKHAVQLARQAIQSQTASL